MVRAAPGHRLVIIEDTAEIQCAAKNAVIMRATDTVDMQRLLKATMRLRPDRIIVGEVRGGEALSLLKAWNTGHPGGVCTVHANHARAGLQRIEQLIAEVSQTPMRALIAEAVNLIVSIVKTDSAPADASRRSWPSQDSPTATTVFPSWSDSNATLHRCPSAPQLAASPADRAGLVGGDSIPHAAHATTTGAAACPGILR